MHTKIEDIQQNDGSWIRITTISYPDVITTKTYTDEDYQTLLNQEATDLQTQQDTVQTKLTDVKNKINPINPVQQVQI